MARPVMLGKVPQCRRFVGVSLGGGKTDKTCLSLIEYYPKQKKIFLSRLFEKIHSEGEVSSDLQLHSLIEQIPRPLESVSFDVPLSLPKCLRCRLKCPGYEACTEPEIQWLWQHQRAKNAKRKPKPLFTPYTERCAEAYVSDSLEEKFYPSQALGANMAPLTARALFITRRLKTPCQEVMPKVSLWRIGRSLGLQKSYLRFHKHSVSGGESRQAILARLLEKNVAFVYQQDQNILMENSQAFDSFLCALTGVLSYQRQCEPRPKGFPKNEAWIKIPKVKLRW